LTRLRRAFVAVVPPPEVLDAIAARVEVARDEVDGLRWMRREQWHCTVQFLGAVDDVEPLVAALRTCVRMQAPFAMQLGSGGAFPSRERGTVLWLGVSKGARELEGLAAAVGEARPFRAHVTVARASTPRDLRAAVTALGSGPAGAPWTVDEIVLLESDTRPDGAVYRCVATFPLGI
jgi:2'-5' RNA ligase